MTYIKSLVMHGFKSFAHKTTFSFPKGLVMLVGENGTGKSNVIDGLCFVLGKISKKSMRAEKLNDLIYNGGKKGKPAKSCSVTVILDNTKKVFPYAGDELSITRIVRRDGKSIYKINDGVVKRQEILNALARANLNPDGYNIILQGDIQKFVDLSPEQRRSIIEEISGISIYENKKHKSMLELGKVENKLKEANAVLSERERFLKELINEKRQAEKYLKLKDELKERKANLLFKKIYLQKARKQGIESRFNSANRHVEEYEKRIRELNGKALKKNEELEGIKSEVEQRGQAEQVRLVRELESLKEKKIILGNQINNYEAEIKRINDRSVGVQKELSDVDNKINKQGLRLKELSSLIKLKNDELSKLKKSYDLSDEVDYLRIKRELQEVEEELLESKGKLLSVKDSREKMKEYGRLYSRQVSAENKLKKINNEINELKGRQGEAGSKLEEVIGFLNNLNVELLKLEARKQAGINYFNKGVREVLKARGRIRGINGTLSELGIVDKRYANALSVAAGGKLSSIITSDDLIAEQCINYLRNNKLGVASFMPLNKVKGSRINDAIKGLRRKSGVIDFAINLINFDEKYRPAFELALGNTLVVHDIESARNIGAGAVRMVTLKGDLIERSGLMTGGYRGPGRVSFIEQGVDESIDSLTFKKKKYERYLKELKRAVTQLREELMKQREERAGQDSVINELKNKLEELKPKIKASVNYDLILNEIKGLEHKRDELKPRTEVKFDKQRLNSVKELIDDLTGKVNNFLIEKNTIESELNNLLIKESSKLKKILLNLGREKKDFNEELINSRNSLSQALKDLKAKQAEESRFYSKLKDFYAKRERAEKLINKLEGEEAKLKDKIYKLRERTQEDRIRLAGVVAKIEGLQTVFAEFRGVQTRLLKKPVPEIEAGIRNLEIKIAGFGNVNLKALDAFNEAKKNYDKVKGKSDKLVSEKQEVINIINEIESKKKHAFLQTFNHVVKNFSEVFSTLSPGGVAKMYLSNPENPFDEGIEIIARPKGKRILTLKSMSGGEKTITALAFIFAIQEYEPAPFYIMDEVDAALDKLNSETLSELLRNYSGNAQFIVITHNDNMISNANYLFGISMNPDGLSSVVSIKLPE